MSKDWPKITITGGPHAKNTKMLVDGVEVKALSHIDVSFDINDAVRVTTHSYVETAELEVEGIFTTRVYLARTKYFAEVTERTPSTAQLAAAIRDLADMVEQDAGGES